MIKNKLISAIVLLKPQKRKIGIILRIGPAHFYKKVFLFAMPVMLQTFIQSLVSLIDNFMVGGLGDIKMSAVNIVNQFVFVFLVTLFSFSDTGGMFMSQFNGAKDTKGMQHSYRFKQQMMLLCAVFFLVISALFSRLIFSFLVEGNNDAHAIVAESLRYMRIILLTFIPLALSTAAASSLRDIGNVKIPMYISFFSAGLNTLGNYIFIYGNFGAPRLEVQGAAYATAAARSIECILFILYLQIKKPPFYIRFASFGRLPRVLFKQMCGKLWLVLASDVSWVATETLVAALYNSRGGAEVVSGMAAGWTIANVFFLLFPAIVTCVRIMIGGLLGQNKTKEARKYAQWFLSGFCLAGVFIGICAACSVIIIPFAFIRLSAESQLITRNLVWVIACYMPLWSYLNTQFAIARAGGDAVLGAWVDMSVNITIFLPLMYILTHYTAMPPVSMFALVKLTDILKVFLSGRQLQKERWVHNLTL